MPCLVIRACSDLNGFFGFHGNLAYRRGILVLAYLRLTGEGSSSNPESRGSKIKPHRKKVAISFSYQNRPETASESDSLQRGLLQFYTPLPRNYSSPAIASLKSQHEDRRKTVGVTLHCPADATVSCRGSRKAYRLDHPPSHQLGCQMAIHRVS